MPEVVSLSDVQPLARFDAIPWTHGIVQESTDGLTGWVSIGPGDPLDPDDQLLIPVDADPTNPQLRGFTASATDATHYFRIRFEDGVGGFSVTGPVTFSGYPTTAELVAESDVEELTDATSAQQDTFRALAIAAVESYAGQSFQPWVGTKLVDGNGGAELFLPARLETLTGVAIVGEAFTDLTLFTVAPEGDRLAWAEPSTNYAVQAMRDPWDTWDTRTFRSGPETVAITGTWGWTALPDAVREAIRLDMEDQALAQSVELSGTIAAYRRLGVKDVSQGNLRMTLGALSQITLSPRAAGLLTGLVWAGPAGYLV